MKPTIMKRAFTLLLCLGCVIVLILLPRILQYNNYYLRLVNMTLINSILVMGLNFITGLTGQMNLGMAGVYSLGAYTSALLATRLGISPWIGLLAAICTGVIIGILLGVPSLKISGIYLALTTIAFGEIVRLSMTNFSDLTGGDIGVRKIPPFSIGSLQLSGDKHFYYLALFFVILLCLVANRIIKSKYGRAFRAIKQNELSVSTYGINISNMKVFAFVLSTVYGCIAGALYASLATYISPNDFSGDLSIRYFMMLMVGGVGTLPGNIIGAFLVTVVPEMLKQFGEYYWLVFCGFVMVFAVLVPNGMYSLLKNLVQSFKRCLQGSFNRQKKEGSECRY